MQSRYWGQTPLTMEAFMKSDRTYDEIMESSQVIMVKTTKVL